MDAPTCFLISRIIRSESSKENTGSLNSRTSSTGVPSLTRLQSLSLFCLDDEEDRLLLCGAEEGLLDRQSIR